MTDARPSLSMGTLLGGRYRISHPLGAGAMGSVYSAVQEGLGRKVAIKVLHGNLAADRDAVARFQREAQAAAALGHPNIVQVIDFLWPQNEPPFLVMEQLEGAPLSQAIRSAGKMDSTRIARIGRQVASALEAAHGASIVHRDIKPDNIFLTDVSGLGEIAKVLDFGIAKLTGPTDAQLTGDNMMLGSPAYMAPEQARGGALDHRADIFSLGSTMYVALSGRLPFDAQSLNALLFAIAEQAPAPLSQLAPGIDPRMVAVVERAMQKDPRARFQSAAELRLALEAIAANAPMQLAMSAPTPMPMAMPMPGSSALPPGQSAAAYSAPPVVPAPAAAFAPLASSASSPWNGAPPTGAQNPYAPTQQPMTASGAPPLQPMNAFGAAPLSPVMVSPPKSGAGAGVIIAIVAVLGFLLLAGGGGAAYFFLARSSTTGPTANGAVSVTIPSVPVDPLAPSSSAAPAASSGTVVPHGGRGAGSHDGGLLGPSIPTSNPTVSPTGTATAAPSSPSSPAAHGAMMSGLNPRCTGGSYGNFPDAFANINAQIALVRPCYAQLEYTPPNHEFFVFRFYVGKDGKVQRFLGGPEGTDRMAALDACVGPAMSRMNFGKAQNGQDGEVAVDLQARLPGNE